MAGVKWRDPLEALRTASAAHMEALAAVSRTTDGLADAIVAASEAGYGYGTIAGYTGLSRSRVQQIVRKARGARS